MDSTISRPMFVGLSGAVLDKFVMGEEQMQKSLMFGGVLAVGTYASEYIGPLIHLIPIPSLARNLYEGKTLVTRIVEIGSNSGLTFIVNKYILRGEYQGEMYKRLAVIAASDVIGTYANDYFMGQPLQFLTDH